MPGRSTIWRRANREKHLAARRALMLAKRTADPATQSCACGNPGHRWDEPTKAYVCKRCADWEHSHFNRTNRRTCGDGRYFDTYRVCL